MNLNQDAIRIGTLAWTDQGDVQEANGAFFLYRVVPTGDGDKCNMFVIVPETLEDRSVTEHESLDKAKYAAYMHHVDMIVSYIKHIM